MCVAYKKSRLYCITHTNTNPLMGDDVSLCAYLVKHIYLPAFYKTIIIAIIKNSSNIGDTVFECVVWYYVACSPWDHCSDSSV